VLASGQGAIGDIGDPESLEEHIQFLEFVAEVEAWLGAPLDPPARPSEGDVGELGRLLGLIRQPQHHGTWDQVRVTTHPGIQVPEGIVEAAVLRPTYAQLFGQKIYAGIEIILLHRARAERQPGTEVLLLPADPERAVTTTLQHPSLAPAEAAQTNMGEGEHRVLFRRPEATPEPPAP
jgi:hypothetical protein